MSIHAEEEDEGLDCSPCCRNERFRSVMLSLLLGQLLSFCLCGTGITSQMLADFYAVDTPTAQSFVNYFFLALIYGSWLACQPGDRGIIEILIKRGWKYFLLAIIDVEANYLMVKAYQYTTITSVQLLDCFTIPCVLVLSFFVLHVRYLIFHIVGVALCLIGVGCVVWGDFEQGKGSLGGSQKWIGDLICLAGATMYAFSNVGEEALVKNFSRFEYLGLVGLFGSIISGIQLAVIERDALAAVRFDKYQILLLYGGFALCMFTFYSLVSLLMQRTSAAFFNLSVLTADFYTLIAGIVLFKYQFHFLYFISFVLVLVGTIVYSIRPTSQRKTDGRRQGRADSRGFAAESVDPDEINNNNNNNTDSLDNQRRIKVSRQRYDSIPPVDDDRPQFITTVASVAHSPNLNCSGVPNPSRRTLPSRSLPQSSPTALRAVSHSHLSSDLPHDYGQRNVRALVPGFGSRESLPRGDFTTKPVIDGGISRSQPNISAGSTPRLSMLPRDRKHGKENVRLVKYCPKHGTVIIDSDGQFIMET